MEFDPETMKIHICKKCKGLGFGIDLKGNRFNCSECNGTGRILVKTLKEEFTLDSLSENLSFDKETMKVRVCKSCGGLGSINYGVEERECEDCHGTGRIIEQKILTEYQLHHVDGIAAAEEKA
ncbi:molecular chaperone DnaJ [Pyramidobacter sp.]|uniref:molecular chaperone DnaJ n=2 Tax=Pyramidobacter TaxID=638847 RepID=UPI00098F3F3B|nr:molecular chaperone DnaJ [Pyramidobacter sp.]MDY3213626.1 molecular chaperone DnaJ [Pyramidobacter sp.]OON86336.1 molecular chaperone DnaJ [Pyramidobacter sp. C12-8]